jgi:hypothetical protein
MAQVPEDKWQEVKAVKAKIARLKERKTPTLVNGYTGPSRLPFDQEIADYLLEQMAQGEYMTYVCKDLEIRPTIIYRWKNGHEGAPSDFAQHYAEAQVAGAGAMVDRSLVLAHEAGEYIESQMDKAVAGEDNPRRREWLKNRARREAIEATKLNIETLRWTASKLDKKTYGDRVGVEVEGGDPERPVRNLVRNMTDEELRAIDEMAEKAAERVG